MENNEAFQSEGWGQTLSAEDRSSYSEPVRSPVMLAATSKEAPAMCSLCLVVGSAKQDLPLLPFYR